MATQTVDQTQTVRLAPFQEKFLADIFKSATDLTGPGSQMPFAKQQLAGLSEGQQQAITSALQGVGSFAPFLQQGAEALGQGIGQLGTAQQRVAAAGIDPTSYQQFMDPFTEDVIARTQQDIADKGAQQQLQAQASAAGQGAFGGSRQAVLQGQIAADVMDQQARTGAQLRSQGFQQAQNLAQQAAQQQLRQAQLTGQLGQTVGQLGMQTAGLGQLGQQMGVQDINTLLGIGSLQQQQGQKQLDIDRANILAEKSLPYQQVGFLSDIFRGVPALQQTFTTQTRPGPDRTSQLIGLGIAGLGAYGMANRGTGNFLGLR
tara:strand:+ start:1631 stop:2581 length:951 start_codon:yes stop_codon:yes gene_type:complete